MKKLFFLSVVLLLCGAVATPAFAAEEGAGSGSHLGFAILGLGIAAAGGALGQGRASSSAAEGMARNPGAGGQIRTTLLLALAFMESLVIFTWVMVYMTRGL